MAAAYEDFKILGPYHIKVLSTAYKPNSSTHRYLRAPQGARKILKMLPSKYTKPTTIGKRPPALGVTGVACQSLHIPVKGGTISGTRYRPVQTPLLVCLPGGPGLSSEYLQALVALVHNQSILLIDPLGCGRSTGRVPHGNYLRDSAATLHQVLEHLPVKNYNLLGHSLGGIVVYHYLKTYQPKYVRNVQLVSAPTSIPRSFDYRRELLEELEDESDDYRRLFRERHECRLYPMPLTLHNALTQMRHTALDETTRSFELPDESLPLEQYRVMLIRGEYDFIRESDLEGWKRVFPGATLRTAQGCAHYSMVETEDDEVYQVE